MKRICLSKGIITTDTTSKVQSIQSELEADRAALVFKAFAETKVGSSLGMQVNFKVDCDIDVSLSFLMMKETQDRAVTGRNCRYTFF